MMFMILVVRRRWFKPQSAPTCLARVYCATEGTLPLFCVLYIDLNPYLLSSPEGIKSAGRVVAYRQCHGFNLGQPFFAFALL